VRILVLFGQKFPLTSISEATCNDCFRLFIIFYATYWISRYFL